jgi:hypothetical protein
MSFLIVSPPQVASPRLVTVKVGKPGPPQLENTMDVTAKYPSLATGVAVGPSAGQSSTPPLSLFAEQHFNGAAERVYKLTSILFEAHVRLFGDPERGPVPPETDRSNMCARDAIQSGATRLQDAITLAESYASQLANRL